MLLRSGMLPLFFFLVVATKSFSAPVVFSLSTVVEGRAEVSGVNEGDTALIEIFADNGNSGLANQSWDASLFHYLGARVTISGGAKVYGFDNKLDGWPALWTCPLSGGAEGMCMSTDSLGSVDNFYLVDLYSPDPNPVLPDFRPYEGPVIGHSATDGIVVSDRGISIWDLFENGESGVIDLRAKGAESWTVATVPLPAALPAFLAVLIGLFGFRARRSA